MQLLKALLLAVSVRWKSKLICILTDVAQRMAGTPRAEDLGNLVRNAVPVSSQSASHRHFQAGCDKDGEMGHGLLCSVNSTGTA